MNRPFHFILACILLVVSAQLREAFGQSQTLREDGAEKGENAPEIITNVGHQSFAKCRVRWSVDGTLLVTMATGKEASSIVIWDAIRGRRLRNVPLPRFRSTADIGISPNNRWLAMSFDGAVRVVEISTGKERWHTEGEFEWGRDVFSPDSTKLFIDRTAPRKGSVGHAVVDVASGKIDVQFSRVDSLDQIAWSADQLRIVGASHLTPKLFNLHTANVKDLGDRKQFSLQPSGHVFLPDGQKFAMLERSFDAKHEMTVHLFSTEGVPLSKFPLEDSGDLLGLWFSANGDLVIAHDTAYKVRLYDFSRETPVQMLGEEIESFAYDVNTHRCLLGKETKSHRFIRALEVFSLQNSQQRQSISLNGLVGADDNYEPIAETRFNVATGQIHFTTGSRQHSGSVNQGDGRVAVADIATGTYRTIMQWMQPIAVPEEIAVGAGGLLIVKYQELPGSWGESFVPLVTWDLSVGQPVYGSRPASRVGDHGKVTLSDNGECLYIPTDFKTGNHFLGKGRVINPRSGATVLDLFPIGDQPACVAISLDGRLLAIEQRMEAVTWSLLNRPDRTTAIAKAREEKVVNSLDLVPLPPNRSRVLVFDIENKEIVAVLPDTDETRRGNEIGAIAFSPDGKALVIDDGYLQTYSTETWQPVSPRSPKGTYASPRGLVTRTDNTCFRVTFRELEWWDVSTNEVRWRSGFIPQCDAQTVSPIISWWAGIHSERKLNNVRVVDYSTGNEVFSVQSVDARDLRLLNNGRLLLTTHEDGWMRLWDTTEKREVCRFVMFPRSGDWIVVTPEGLFDGNAGGREKVFYRVGTGNNVVPVDRFFQDFYYPGLLAAVYRGERPKPNVQLGDQLPPLLAIESPTQSGSVDEQRVLLTVTATDQGGGIKGPSLKHNGARLIGAVQSTERLEGMIRRQFAVDLIEGENVLEVVSATADGSFESEPARLSLQYNQSLPKSRLHLVSIGVDHYADPNLAMNFSGSDCDEFTNVFESRGTDLYGEVLTTSVRNDKATTSGIRQAIAELADNARPQDTIIVFVSGHGALVESNFYFLPHEFERQSASLEHDIRSQGLPAASIGDWLAEVPALKRMIVFDTGQSGSSLPIAKTSRNPFAFRGAIERLSRSQGAFTIASASVSDEAKEVEELGHGILAYSMLAGLNAVSDGPLSGQSVQPSSSDKVASAVELFSFASSRTRQLGKQFFGQEQEVQFSSSGMTFPVLHVRSGAAADSHTASPSLVAKKQQPRTSATASVESATIAQDGATLYVVAVGINDYSQASLNLKYAAPDAVALSELLKLRGEPVFAEVDVTTLLNERATRKEILAAIAKIAKQAKPTDTLAVFLGGHGTMVGQRYYFIPHEFASATGTLENDIREQALAADALGDAIASVPTEQRLLIFDTCASGGAIALNKQGADPFAFRGAIEQLGKSGGTFTLAAVGSTEEAQEVAELGHGLLTYSLLAAAGAVDAGPLADRTLQPAAQGGVADVLEWFSYASGAVPRLNKRCFGREQQVQLGGQGKAFPVLSVR